MHVEAGRSWLSTAGPPGLIEIALGPGESVDELTVIGTGVSASLGVPARSPERVSIPVLPTGDEGWYFVRLRTAQDAPVTLVYIVLSPSVPGGARAPQRAALD